jgi:hypothetical protein
MLQAWSAEAIGPSAAMLNLPEIRLAPIDAIMALGVPEVPFPRTGLRGIHAGVPAAEDPFSAVIQDRSGPIDLEAVPLLWSPGIEYRIVRVLRGLVEMEPDAARRVDRLLIQDQMRDHG